MANNNNDYSLNKWKAEFRDAGIETAYRQQIQEKTATHLRIALLVWAGLLMAFAWLDYTDLGANPTFYQLLTLRSVQSCLLLGLAWWVSRQPLVATNGWPVTLLMISGFPLLFIIFFLRPDIIMMNLVVILIVLLSMFIFIPNRVALTSIAALFGIAGTLLSLYLLGTSGPQLVGLLLLLLLPAIPGFISAHRLQMSQRQEFALLNQVVQTNQTLNAEIERRKELERELQQQANTDMLTGLSNRREYEAIFARELARCRRQESPLSVGVIDLDHFKQINDAHGHNVGDEMLRHVAAVLQGPLRESDLLGRFGGEEFVLILPDTSLDEAGHVVERLRATLENNPVIRDGKPIRLTATFGITEVTAGDKGIETVIQRADQAMYQGKQTGRNRVSLMAAAASC